MIGKFVDMRTRSDLHQFYVATLNTEFSTCMETQIEEIHFQWCT